ncbi:hypothetical protein HYZ41_02310 [archaeon]|nr:hypothetical protein [archaeon]
MGIYETVKDIADEHRNFYSSHRLDEKRFHIYCEALVLAVSISKKTIDEKTYETLGKMKKEEIIGYLMKSERTKP